MGLHLQIKIYLALHASNTTLALNNVCKGGSCDQFESNTVSVHLILMVLEHFKVRLQNLWATLYENVFRQPLYTICQILYIALHFFLDF